MRIRGGTRPTARLCDQCRYSHIVTGPKQGEEIVLCNENIRPFYPPFPVVECNQFISRVAMSRGEAEEMGWVLHMKGGRPAGFKPPEREPQQ